MSINRLDTFFYGKKKDEVLRFQLIKDDTLAFGTCQIQTQFIQVAHLNVKLLCLLQALCSCSVKGRLHTLT